MIAARPALGIELVERLGQALIALIVIKGALHEADSFGEPVPDLLAKRRASVIFDGVEDQLREILVRPISAREPHQREVGGQ